MSFLTLSNEVRAISSDVVLRGAAVYRSDYGALRRGFEPPKQYRLPKILQPFRLRDLFRCGLLRPRARGFLNAYLAHNQVQFTNA